MSGRVVPRSFPWPKVYMGFDVRSEVPTALLGEVDLVCTSTPYWSKAKYSDEAGEWGAGTIEEFVADQVSFARRMWDVTREGGWFALNLGDSRVNTGGAGGDVARAGQRVYRPDRSHGIVGQQWAMVPAQCALAIRGQTEWRLAGHAIWDKGRPVRSDNSAYHLARNRRPGLQHEDVFLFWKPGDRQTWNHEVLVDAGEIGSVWRITPSTTRPPRAQRSDDVKPWPEALAARCVRLLSNPSDLVLDPCAGYGTTARVAEFLDRRGVALDLYWGTDEWPDASDSKAIPSGAGAHKERDNRCSPPKT